MPPVAEATGLPYASTKVARDEEGIEVGVSHVCGHDLHVACLKLKFLAAAHMDHILSAVKRICCAECSASNAPRDPEFTDIDSYPVTENDAAATAKLAEAFNARFGDKSFETKPASASEDFSIFGRNWKVPYVFWFVGGTDPKIYLEAKKNNKINTIPSNHSPKFAPVIHPTLKTGLAAMMTAAVAWLK